MKIEQTRPISHLQSITCSDEDNHAIESFCARIQEDLDRVTPEGKLNLIELLDVRGTLTVENDEK